MANKNIVIITGSELRHNFFRNYLASANGISVLKSYCETLEGNLQEKISLDSENTLRAQHLLMREETEKDFFQLYCENTQDKSNPTFIRPGEINNANYVNEIKELNPDIIVSYGCCIIKPPLIKFFKRRFLNIHLGLSPYYRGSGTNFWPFVNKELQYVGVTFMYIDEGVDTGEVIHQIRPLIIPGDNIHQIGNRLIRDMAICCALLIKKFNQLEKPKELLFDEKLVRYYRNKDFSEESVAKMYENFKEGLVSEYLKNKSFSDAEAPILYNKTMSLQR
jgi:phosphoribosylglycinamide formyltransferase-1